MRKLGVAVAMTIAAIGAAHAADLPTKKEAAPPLPPNCFSSIWAFMDSSAADCPLSYGPLTFYATLDIGLQYESNGAAWSPTQPNGTASFINKQAYGSKWLWSPNNLSQSVVGLKLSQPVAYGWSVVGTVETGFQPLSWNLSNGARSLANGIIRRASSGSATPLMARWSAAASTRWGWTASSLTM
jgi:hypothetical protein